MRRGIAGEVGLFAGQFAPGGWKFYEGLPDPVPNVHPIVCVDGETPSPEHGGTNPTLGEIRLLAAAVTLQEWYECSGALISMATHPALHSILETTFGGDGVETFAAPKLKAPPGLRYILAHTGTYPDYRGSAGSDPPGQTLAEIRLWPSERIPFGWAACDGSPIQLHQYTALYSVLGDTFGGDGRTFFSLPRIALPFHGVRFVICINGTYPVRP